MPNPILLKFNATAGVVPAAAAMTVRELALNTADGRLFTKTVGGAVVEFARKDAVGALSAANTWGAEQTVDFAPSVSQAHYYAKGASGALGREGKIRFGGTFGAGTADTGSRFIASIRAGFNGGVWGTEYLDFYLNSAGNDAASDANQGKVLRFSYDKSATFYGKIKSTVVTGTAPLEVASTTNVTNLNADLLDGSHRDTTHNSFGAGTIPVRHSSGYLYSNYFNCTADTTATAPSNVAVMTGTDNFIRWQTWAQFKAHLGSLPAASASVSVISANTTAVAGNTYVLTASLTLTLPATPAAGNMVTVSNRSGTATCVVARNAQNIMGLAEDMTLDGSDSVRLLFADATRGWVLI